MDIASLSTAMSQSKVMEQANISLTKIAMDSGKQTAQAMTDMIQASNPNLGQHLDVKA